jgi:hypothetical protein
MEAFTGSDDVGNTGDYTGPTYATKDGTPAWGGRGYDASPPATGGLEGSPSIEFP